MNGKAVILPLTTQVVVTLGADSKGVLSLGIRINGGTDYTMAQAVIVPKAGESQAWSQQIGNLI
jgi:hypothetical protein